jgi:multimeric flavodoxin WrbA
MHILGIVGSARKGRETETIVHHVLDGIGREIEDVRSDIIYTSDLTIAPCRVQCSSYCKSHPYRCSIQDDASSVFTRMAEADALVIGTPRYFRGPPAGFHALVERLTSMAFFYESQGEGASTSPVAGKACGLVAVAEYSNPHHLLEYLVDFCSLLGMNPIRVPRFPYLGVGVHGTAEDDAVFQPLERARDLAQAVIRAVERDAP